MLLRKLSLTLLLVLPTLAHANICDQSETVKKLSEQCKYWECRYRLLSLIIDYNSLNMIDFWKYNNSSEHGEKLLFLAEGVKSEMRLYNISPNKLKELVNNYVSARNAFEERGCYDIAVDSFKSEYVFKIHLDKLKILTEDK